MHILDIKMVGGDKPFEDFVLAKEDMTEYMVPTVSSVVAFPSHSILVQSCSAIS